MVEISNADSFDWEEAARTTGASERQVRFCQEIVKGASYSKAAELAGYQASSKSGMRSQGHSTFRSPKVQALLALAGAAGAGFPDDVLRADEAKKILSGMARRGDPNSKVRAIQALQAIEAVEREAGLAEANDGMGDWRTCRDFLMMMGADGAAGWLLLKRPTAFGCLPLFHDWAPLVRSAWPGIWDTLLSRHSDMMRDDALARLGDREFQLAERKRSTESKHSYSDVASIRRSSTF